LLRYKEIFLGGPCSNNCLYCPASHKSSPQIESTHITASLKQEGEDGIALYGGEPALRSDLPEIIRTARENGFRRIKLLTNGRAFSDIQFLQRVITAGCCLFEIKLWGSNPSLHDHITKTPGSFWETINGLENLAGLSGDKFVCIRIPVCKENYTDVENTVVTSLNFGINRIVLSVQDHRLSFESILPHVKNAINISIFNRTWIQTEGIPFCVMKGLEPHIGEILNDLNTPYENLLSAINIV
jgi:MoaA/NifB/PqqE/SkfB family radical SAM enzyme